MLVPTTDGLVIYDGRSAQVVATLGSRAIGLQNSPMVTIDPNGTIGITIAGYNAPTPGSSSTTRSPAPTGTRWASGRGRCSTRTPS